MLEFSVAFRVLDSLMLLSVYSKSSVDTLEIGIFCDLMEFSMIVCFEDWFDSLREALLTVPWRV